MMVEERREFLTHVPDSVVIDTASGDVVGVVPTPRLSLAV